MTLGVELGGPGSIGWPRVSFRPSAKRIRILAGGALLCVTYLKQEPYAVILHVRICAGGNPRPYRNRFTERIRRYDYLGQIPD
jgi:hypothetical protein